MGKFLILYVDDEEHNLISFAATFRKDYQIHTMTNGNHVEQWSEADNHRPENAWHDRILASGKSKESTFWEGGFLI